MGSARDGNKPLLHIWSPEYNLTRRVIAITDHSEASLVLAVERFGRARPGTLEFVRTDFERPAGELLREEFCERLAQILGRQFPDETVESITSSADLEHSLSGNCARGVLERGSSHRAFLVVADGETQDHQQQFDVWIAVAGPGAKRESPRNYQCAAGDRTQDTCSIVAHRIAARSMRWFRAMRRPSRCTLRLRPAKYLRYRGLPFARWDDGKAYFGCNEAPEELTGATRSKLNLARRRIARSWWLGIRVVSRQ